MIVAEQQREICRELKNLIAKMEDNIKRGENRIELMIEASERPPAGIRRLRPNSAHNYWIGGLRTNGWIRIHNY
jgi:hypothetical protein